MKGTATRFVKLGISLLGLVTLGWVLGKAAAPEQFGVAMQGMPLDWSHRHVIFSQPATDRQAASVMNDPRYWQQWNRQHLFRVLQSEGADPGVLSSGLGIARDSEGQPDWSQNLGSGANAGAGTFPAKYSFQVTTATCGNGASPDYVVFSTGLAGSATQASVVAFDNLYSGCSGTVPSVYWAYNTGGQILTSPTISGDGTQVAFVQTNGGGIGTLVLLKWKASTTQTVSSPRTLSGVSNAAYRNCTAPCMTTLDLRDSLGVTTDDTTSSVFPDYTHDVIWVGGARGWLQKFTGVFRGTPTRVTTGGFPVQMNAANPNPLSSPVYDFTTTNVYVGDYGGFLYRVSSAGVVTRSGQVDFGTGLVAGPIVDSTAGRVYVFSSSDGSTACPGATPCSAVNQFATNFAANNTGTRARVGTSRVAPPNPNPMFEGGFDAKYQASANATGNLYVCGNTGGVPTLYQIPINAGTMGTVVTGPTLTGATTGCSPVTDISNPNATGGATEWIFASVQASGSGNVCGGGGCIMNFESTQWIPSHAYAIGDQILDTHFQIQTCRVAGTSRTTTPNWNTALGGNTNDGTVVRWVNQGPQHAAHGPWQASHAYGTGSSIMDSNGNVQVILTAGTSKSGTHPVWATVINGNTNDGSARWRNAGTPATASLAATGGTGGIIIDNTVGSGTLAGASQVYFTTQGNQTCGTSGTGGCAVQASQAGLN